MKFIKENMVTVTEAKLMRAQKVIIHCRRIQKHQKVSTDYSYTIGEHTLSLTTTRNKGIRSQHINIGGRNYMHQIDKKILGGIPGYGIFPKNCGGACIRLSD